MLHFTTDSFFARQSCPATRHKSKRVPNFSHHSTPPPLFLLSLQRSAARRRFLRRPVTSSLARCPRQFTFAFAVMNHKLPRFHPDPREGHGSNPFVLEKRRR